MPNRLLNASSPYLRQHADNPVDWHEWGKEAFNEAATRDVPVLLSVGYSACHWCHVMAHESFEDDTTADFMNEHFVNVKVDREERPDLDRIYMEAVQAMTGQGGWPMTLMLTPGGEPFFAGTYFPKNTRGRYPSFMQVIMRIHRAWEEERGDLEEQARRLTSAVRRELPPSDEIPGAYAIRAAVEQMATGYDWEHGGFGGAPKFPQAPNLELLLRMLALGVSPDAQGAVEGMLRASLDNMAAGGIYDHLGGGFARYAVDRTWLVPHFEKMLYDNALLARVYVRAWQLTGNADYRTVARETLDYILGDLRHPEGGLFSAEDADSEGVEGKFYTWTLDELLEVLGDEAQLVSAVYGVTAEGNFEGTNILHRPRALDEIASEFDIATDEIRARVKDAGDRLRTARARRVRPGLDDKVITAWNGFGLRALAEAGAILGDEPYVEAGRAIARFVRTHLTEEGRLRRSWRDGVVSGNGFCDDYAAMAVGLFSLYQATGEIEWYHEAQRLTREMVRLFADPQGGFYATGNDAERLIARPKNLMDNPTPSDNSLAAEALLILAAYTGDPTLTNYADGVFLAGGRLLEQHPGAVGHLLAVLAVAGPGLKEVAIIGERDRRRPLEQVIWDTFRPDCVLAASESPGSEIPLLVDRTSHDDTPLAYVCRNFTCELPVDTPDALRQQLGEDAPRIGAD